jgi:hypothetical protein
MINQYTRRALLCRFVILLSGVVFLRSMLPISAEEKTPAIDKAQIIGVWLAKPFDVPEAVRGIEPKEGRKFNALRIEFKEGGKFRAFMQDHTETEGTWERMAETETEGLEAKMWAQMSVIELTYPKLGVKISHRFFHLSKKSMAMSSSGGRYTHYFRLKSWDAKSP